MFRMSPLQFRICAAAGLMAALVIYELASWLADRRRIASGEVPEPPERKDGEKSPFVKYNKVPRTKGRILTEGLLIIATGAMIVASVAAMARYDRYGAFYDASWRVPEAEDHFLFRSDGTKRLQEDYDAAGGELDFSAYKICLVKFGCADCEKVAETIRSLEDDPTWTVVFSNSPVGEAVVEEYGVNFVPSIVFDGQVVELRWSDAAPDDDPGVGDMVDGIMEGMGDEDAGPSGPGTVAGIHAAEEDAGNGG